MYPQPIIWQYFTIYIPIVKDHLMTSISRRKEKSVSARKPIRRKSKDTPKRARSAYNYFFKEERQKIVKAASCMCDAHRKVIDLSLTEDQIKKLLTHNGKVSFEEVGKIIGAGWRRISEAPDRVSYYNSLAGIDAERYAKDKEKHNNKNNDQSYTMDMLPNIYHNSYQMPHNMRVQAPSMSASQSGLYHGHLGHPGSYHFNHAHSCAPTPFNQDYMIDASHEIGQYRSYHLNPYQSPIR